MTKNLQFELWQECNNKCVYCTLGKYSLYTPNEMKLDAINTATLELSKLKHNDVNSLGFIGGEFFQGQLCNEDILNAFNKLILLCNDLLNKDIISELWLNATLTIGDQKDLYNTLELIDRKEKLWILTSYDNIGRFHTNKMLNTWKYHMSKLNDLYPQIKRNTTGILTGDFINNYNNDEIDLLKFKKQYNTSVYLKTPVKPDDKINMSKADINKLFGYEFFPKRAEFLQFLFKYQNKEGLEDFSNLFSNELKAQELHKNFNDSQLRDVVFTRTIDYKETLNCDSSLKEINCLPCGHSNIYACYVDSPKCVICDKLMF